MRIKTIKLENFKSLTATYDLQPVTVITASNFAGKTAILTAIRLALTGYLPEPIGKRSDRLFALSSGDRMSVELVLDNDRQVRWMIEKRSDGAISRPPAIPLDLAMPPLLNDAKQFFAMTGAQQIQTVFNACQVRDFGSEDIKSKLSTIQFSPVSVCEDVLDKVALLVQLAFNGQTAQEACVKLIDVFKGRAVDNASEAKAKSGAFEAFRVNTGERPKDRSADIQAVEQQLRQMDNDKTGERTKLQLEVVRFEKALITALRAEQNCKDTGYDCEKGGFTPNWNVAAQLKVTAISEDIKKAELELSAAKKKRPTDIGKLETEMKNLLDELQELDLSRDAMLAANQADQTLQQQAPKLKLCKKCRQAVAQSISDRLEERSVLLESQRTNRQKLDAKIKTLQGRLASASRSNDEAEGAVMTLQSDKDSLEAKQELIQTTLEEYLKAKNALAELPDGLEDTELRSKLAQLRLEQQRFVTYENDIKRRGKLEEELLAAQCRENVYKAVVKLINEEQERVMSNAFTSVLSVSQKFTDGILNSPLEFKSGSLGRRVSKADRADGNPAPLNHWIDWTVMSETEKLVAFNAFGIALCKDYPLKIVFLDELGIVQQQVKTDLIGRMVRLVETGVIDMAVGTDNSAEAYRTFADCPAVKVLTL